MYTLTNTDNAFAPVTIGTYATAQDAYDHLQREGYRILDFVEDHDNPGFYDIAASRGRLDLTLFIIEPRKDA